MFRYRNFVCRCFLLFIGISFIGCVAIQPQEVKSPVYEDLTAKEFPKEIKRLNALASGAKDRDTRAEAHLRLAILYTDPNNPQLDYSIALAQAEEYIRIAGRRKGNRFIESLVGMLKEIKRLEDEREGIKKSKVELLNENKKLHKDIEEQKQKIREMKETIEKLKLLDLQFEKEKRDLKK